MNAATGVGVRVAVPVAVTVPVLVRVGVTVRVAVPVRVPVAVAAAVVVAAPAVRQNVGRVAMGCSVADPSAATWSPPLSRIPGGRDP